MFTQKISMDCSQEQYEKYLKAELEKMGYEEGNDLDGQYIHITNRYNNKTGVVNGLCSPNIEFFGRTYLGKFNADLFLALAAMTDREYGNYGEWCVRKKDGKWEKSVVTRGDEDDYINPYWRKATVLEIMAKFGEQPKKDIYITLAFEKEPIDVTTKIDKEQTFIATEEQMIAHLKSKGYRIFKQTTTLEEV